MKLRFVFLIGACLGIATSCVNRSVESEPSGATIIINGRNFGTTPRVVRIAKDYPIVIEKDGYKSHSGTISMSTSKPYVVTLEPEKAGTSSVSVEAEGRTVTTRKEVVHAETNTIEKSPNVKSVRKITDLPESAWLGDFNISPDGKVVVFQQFEEFTEENDKKKLVSNLWCTPTSIGPVRRLTQGKFYDRSPSFSPNGKYIYFSSNRLASFDVWKLSFISGSGLALETNTTMQESYPSMSPDASTLLFQALIRGEKMYHIWTLSKGGALTQLKEGRWPRWYADGDSIIFCSLQQSSGDWKLWTMNKDASSPVQLSTSQAGDDKHPAVSPDGKKIVFSSNRALSSGKKNYDIWLCNIDGSKLTQLTTNGSQDDNPIFSPDGKTIYFRSNRGVKWDIWAMDIAVDDVPEAEAEETED